MESVHLPVTLPGGLDLAALNTRLRAGEATLIWTAVETAPAEALATMLQGLDLSDHADALGLGTIPEWLGDALLGALATTPAGPAGTSLSPPPAHEQPVVWTVPAAPELPPVIDDAAGDTEEGDDGESAPTPHLQTPSATDLRAMMEAAVLRDLLGPANGPDEEIAETSVRERYLVGLLAPRGESLAPEQSDDATTAEAGGEDGPTDSAPSPGRSMYPSSFGITFTVAEEARALRLTCRWGRYRRIYSERLKDPVSGNPKLVWQRTQVEETAPSVPLREGPIEAWTVDAEQPDVTVAGIVRQVHGDWVVTLFLINGQQEGARLRDAEWLFQPELIVEAPRDAADPAIFRRRPYALADGVGDASEERLLEMGYRDEVEFAVGHGVSVRATAAPGDPRRAIRVQTAVVPTYEVPRITPPTVDELPALRGLVLDMRELAELEHADLGGALAPLPAAYADWLAEQGARLDDPAAGLGEYAAAARAALANCHIALRRIREGIALLAGNPQAARAFAFMNRAMWLQRTRSLHAETVRQGHPVPLDVLDVPKNRTWYPFQLAFILINLPALADLGHPDRADDAAATADLLWFPTGGGKTEAYLGLTAFTLATRRLQGVVAGHDGGEGVAVLMRYTLRLLTLQQFQRASALICACEMVRREARERGDRTWGETPFRVGLWVGQKTTPSYTSQSDAAVKELRGLSKPGGVGSPAVLTNCPWCGTKIDEQRHITVETVGSGHGRTYIYCGDPLGRCPFSERQAPREGLPVLVVDEEIYRRLPALLIATVDKFAQLPWNGATMMLFGRVTGYCPRHGFISPMIDEPKGHPKSHPARNGLPATQLLPHPPLRPPDLIIQDELHLISGPLGTLVGLYETAVDALASWEVDGRVVRPKVVASTATIRQADEQIHSLFLRRVRVFPPQALDAGDTFFARQRTPGEEYPGRRYMGICAPGRRLKAVLIRVYVAHLAAAQQLYKRYGAAADPWMTLIGYFNSMRELGGMRRLVEDDVQARLRRTDQRGLERRPSLALQELTSRRSSTDIPALLDRLELRFDPAQQVNKGQRGARAVATRPLDVLLATNMVSVGVDVKRLGLMVVSGQPKSTAEYIQATSRVGRSQPGLVCTVYNWTRPRDLSHYERFMHYHATFYRHVEALSVTPFAPRALDRGLSALLVALIRLPDQTFNDNQGAGRVTREHPHVQRALASIQRRAVAAGGAAATLVTDELEKRLRLWLDRADPTTGPQRLGYKDAPDDVTRGLLLRAGDGRWERFTLLNSLRDVEPTVDLILDDGAIDDPLSWTTRTPTSKVEPRL